MKHDTIERATTMRLEQAIAGGHGAATAASGTHRPRRGRVVSEAIISPFVAGLDAVTIFAAGVVAMRWDPSGVDWRLEGLVILLGALLGMNFLHLAGAHRFAQFADLGGAIGRALLGWLITLSTLVVANSLVEPVTAANGPWIALWFSGGVVLLVSGRVVLHHQMKSWSRAGR
ncbi:MAG TPA: hypothetical protein VF991_13925, partial [Reyranella sp.]